MVTPEVADDGGRCGKLISRLTESQYKWRDDAETHCGYCRQNRLLFSDYRGGCRRFIVFEMSMCVVTGMLDGSRGGGGYCISLLVALVVVLFLYTGVLITVRPQGELVILLFSLVTSLLQCVCAVSMLIYSLWDAGWALDVAQMISLLLLYLLLVTTLMTIYPRLRQVLHYVQKVARTTRDAIVPSVGFTQQRSVTDKSLLDTLLELEATRNYEPQTPQAEDAPNEAAPQEDELAAPQQVETAASTEGTQQPAGPSVEGDEVLAVGEVGAAPSALGVLPLLFDRYCDDIGAVCVGLQGTVASTPEILRERSDEHDPAFLGAQLL